MKNFFKYLSAILAGALTALSIIFAFTLKKVNQTKITVGKVKQKNGIDNVQDVTNQIKGSIPNKKDKRSERRKRRLEKRLNKLNKKGG